MNNTDILKFSNTKYPSSATVIVKREDTTAGLIMLITETQNIGLLFSNSGAKAVTAQKVVAMANLWEQNNANTQNISTKHYLEQIVEATADQDLDDLEMLDLYVKPQPTKKFKVKGTVKSIKKGEIKFFPDEFDTL